MDDHTYRLTPLDWGRIVLQSAGITGIVAFLFYDSPFPLLGFPLCLFFCRKRWLRERLAKQRRELAIQFQEAMQTVRSALQSGSSLENAWREAQREQALLHGTQAVMCRELCRMNQSVGLNMPLEQLLWDFAQRSGVEEIAEFSEVVSFAKRSGGDIARIISDTVYQMRAKAEVTEEIAVLVASRKLEQTVMSVIPLLLLAYLKLTARAYLSVLYGNLPGIVFMTGCLAAYGAALLLAEKILRIQV